MKILIVGNFRTGSWTLLKKLKEEHNLGSMGELFSEFRAQEAHELIEEKFNTFAYGKNVIAKLHPTQLERGFLLNSNEIIDISLKFCKFADKIIYTHRRNTLEQVVSYTVAREQAVGRAFANPEAWLAGDKDMTPFDPTRDVYTKEMTDVALLNGYRRLLDGHNYIQKIYEKYPREVITMEDVKPYKPYPNQYKYKGSWQPPTNFILGKGEIEPNSNNENT